MPIRGDLVKWVIIGIVVGFAQTSGLSTLYSAFSTPATTNRVLFVGMYEVFVFVSSSLLPFVGGWIGAEDLKESSMRRVFVWTSVGCLIGTLLLEPFLNEYSTLIGTPSIYVTISSLSGLVAAYGWVDALVNLFGAVLLVLAFPFYAGAFAFIGVTANLSKRREIGPIPGSSR